MKRIILLLAIILFSISVYGQGNKKDVVYTTGAPTGTCSERWAIDRVTGKGYSCVSGVWTLMAPGATSPGGTPGQLQINNSGSFGGIILGGDCTFASPNVTCTKSGGVSFAAVATSGLKSDVGLGNVDNTSDANKPVSTAQQTALDLKLNLAGGTVSGALSVSGASFGLTGAISGAGIFGTSGIRYKNVASTLTDTSSSGTVATNYTNVFGNNTLAATNATVITNAFNTYISDPVAGPNVTLTNRWALGADSVKIGTSNQLTVSNAGAVAVGGTSSLVGNVTVSSGATTSAQTDLLINPTTKASGNFADFQIGGVSKFSVTQAGALTTSSTINAGTNLTAGSSIALGSTGSIFFGSRSGIYSPADGAFRLSNNADNAGATIRTAAASPSQITSNQDNYNPGASSYFIRLSSDASRNITGLVFTAAQGDGEYHYIWNVGSQNIVLQNENASSTSTNRFTTSTGADLTLGANKCALAMYDSTSARWRVTLLP